MDPSNAKEIRDGAIRTAAEILFGRAKGLEERRDSILGHMSPHTSFLSSKEQSILRRAFAIDGKEPP